MNLKELKDLINLMNDNGLTELEVEKEGTKIKIKKSTADSNDSYPVKSAPYRAEMTPAVKPVEPPVSMSAATPGRKQIISPMVGTFYRASSPEAPPFVELGQIVEVGQVVCIVEAMKLMNEIKSEVRGKVVEVLIDNAEPVEFGQPLFTLEAV